MRGGMRRKGRLREERAREIRCAREKRGQRDKARIGDIGGRIRE